MTLAWHTLGKYLAGAAACVVLGLLGFSGDDRMPLLAWIDLGIHESGHLVTLWLPEMATAMAGSVGQVAVPLALGAYFALRRRDAVATSLCAAWAGTSANATSVYIADAPTETLPLVGGGVHDWTFVLGPEGFDAIQSASAIASADSTAGAILVIFGVTACLAWPFVQRDRECAPTPREEGPATRP